jgi:hypothetical protein
VHLVGGLDHNIEFYCYNFVVLLIEQIVMLRHMGQEHSEEASLTEIDINSINTKPIKK